MCVVLCCAGLAADDALSFLARSRYAAPAALAALRAGVGEAQGGVGVVQPLSVVQQRALDAWTAKEAREFAKVLRRSGKGWFFHAARNWDGKHSGGPCIYAPEYPIIGVFSPKIRVLLVFMGKTPLYF